MLKFLKGSTLAASMSMMVAVVTVSGTQPTLAQGTPPGRPSIGVQAFNACTTTNYADTAAKALGITAAVLRKDIVSGQTIQAIATSANVPFQTVSDALQAARKVDIDQAVQNGVITQAEGTAMEATPSGPATASAPVGTRPSGTQFPRPAPGTQFPDISTINLLLQSASGTPPAPGPGGRGGGFGGFGAGLFDLVKPYAVAAQALNLKCTDLVITLITPPGKSVVAVATTQNIDPQTVSNALTKAYQDALAQDVTDSVITQAQSDQLSTNLATAVAAFISNPTPMQARPLATATP